jgi:hypothetical protein
MTLDDQTNIVHSESKIVDNKEQVKVYIEKPVDGGFKSVECYLPDYTWKNNQGFSKDEMNYFDEFIHSVSHIIIDLARNGGFDNAANF